MLLPFQHNACKKSERQTLLDIPARSDCLENSPVSGAEEKFLYVRYERISWVSIL